MVEGDARAQPTADSSPSGSADLLRQKSEDPVELPIGDVAGDRDGVIEVEQTLVPIDVSGENGTAALLDDVEHGHLAVGGMEDVAGQDRCAVHLVLPWSTPAS
jgi:hypothetical protein